MSGELEKSHPVSNLRRRLTRTGSESTADTYIRRLDVFFKWLGQTPEQFLEGIESGEIDIIRTLNRFLDDLHERGRAPSTQAGHISAIKKLVEVNIDATINWKRVELPKLKSVEEDSIPTKGVIRQVLLYADPKERAIALVAASSGMREGTLTKLSIGDVDLESEPDIGIVRVPADKSKGKVKYVTFFSPEAREALDAYLSTRDTLGSEDPVFATRIGGFYSRPDKLARRWMTPLEKAGLDQTSRKWRDYRFHVLRKFFRTAMEYAGVSKSFRERMLGHAGDYLDSAYFGPEFDKLKEQYRKAIPHLTIEEFIGEERMQSLEEELAETRRAFEVLKDATVGRMMRQLEAAGVDTSKTPYEIAKEMGLLEALGKSASEEAMALIRGGRAEQKVIEEPELVAHLSGGWRFVAQLNNGSGKIIVEK